MSKYYKIYKEFFLFLNKKQSKQKIIKTYFGLKK